MFYIVELISSLSLLILYVDNSNYFSYFEHHVFHLIFSGNFCTVFCSIFYFYLWNKYVLLYILYFKVEQLFKDMTE